MRTFWKVSMNNSHFVSLATPTRAPPEAYFHVQPKMCPRHILQLSQKHPRMCLFKIPPSFMLVVSLSGPWHTLLFWVKSCILHLFSLRGGKKEKKNTTPTCPQSYFNLFFLQLFYLASSRRVLGAPSLTCVKGPVTPAPFPWLLLWVFSPRL